MKLNKLHFAVLYIIYMTAAFVVRYISEEPLNAITIRLLSCAFVCCILGLFSQDP